MNPLNLILPACSGKDINSETPVENNQNVFTELISKGIIRDEFNLDELKIFEGLAGYPGGD